MNGDSMVMGQPNLVVFAETLHELAEKHRDLLIVTSDSRDSGKLAKFSVDFPEQTIEVGVAEQNLVGVSAGLASMGKKVYTVSPACFLTARSLEQIKNDVAYSNNHVKLIGISAGVSYGALGTTHHSLHDFATLLSINNIDIIAPADNFETSNAIRASFNHKKPIYIRFGKKPIPNLHDQDTKFEIGKAIQLTPKRAEYEVAIHAIGEVLVPAFEAVPRLKEQGLNVCLLSVHTLHPFDEDQILEVSRRSKVVITVEEHSIHGGLGSMTATSLMQNKVFRPMRILGLPDERIITGSQVEIFNHYGISADGIVHTAKKLLEQQ